MKLKKTYFSLNLKLKRVCVMLNLKVNFENIKQIIIIILDTKTTSIHILINNNSGFIDTSGDKHQLNKNVSLFFVSTLST